MTHTIDTKLRFTGTTSPVTSNYTCAAGVTVLVVSVVTAGATNRAGGNPTYNGVALTQADILRKYATSPETSCELFYLLDPPTGSAYQISVPNTGTRTLYVVASSYKAGTGYKSVLDQQNGGTGATLNPSVSVTTTVAGDVIVGVMGNGQISVPTGRSGTILYEIDDGQYTDDAQYYLQANLGAWATSWTVAADDWCVCVAAFKEIAGATTYTKTFGEVLQVYDATVKTGIFMRQFDEMLQFYDVLTTEVFKEPIPEVVTPFIILSALVKRRYQ